MNAISKFTCPHCGMTSANLNDAREGYCGKCHDWTGGSTWAMSVERAEHAQRPNDPTWRDSTGDRMTFSEALDQIKAGRCVSREGWNGKGMFIFLVPGSRFQVNRPPLLGIYEEGTEVQYHAHIDMKTAQGDIVPWLASQTDLLADDWGLASVQKVNF